MSNRGDCRTRLPITHCSFDALPDDMLGVLTSLHEQHGPIASMRDRDDEIIFIFGPKYNKQVLSDTRRFHSYFAPIRGPRNSAQRRLTSGLLTLNGDRHRQHRRLLQAPFQRISHAGYHEQLVTLAEEMVSSWKIGEIRDIHADMTQFMLLVTSTILFGFDQPDLAAEIGVLIDRWIAANHDCGASALVREGRNPALYALILQYADEVEAKIREMIDLRRSANSPGNDILSILLRTEAAASGLMEDEIVGHAAMLFGAAHLTTARTLAWTIFLLAEHPQVSQELQTELRCELKGSPPTVDQLERMTFLGWVVKESMRILPASAHSQRVAVEPVQLGPFKLRYGTPVIFSPYVTHRMADLYSEPRRFLPERWRIITPSAYEYLPFGAGPRMCLGGPLAMMIVKIALPIILQKFRLSLLPNVTINPRVVHTMLSPTSGIPVQIESNSTGVSASPVRGSIHSLLELPAGCRADLAEESNIPRPHLMLQDALPAGAHQK